MPGLRDPVTGYGRTPTQTARQILVPPAPFRPIEDIAGTGYLVLCKPGRLCYTLPAREHLFRLFLGSSAVEHSTVNRMVAGSNPARGAIEIKQLAGFHGAPRGAFLIGATLRATTDSFFDAAQQKQGLDDVAVSTFSGC